MTIDHPAHLRDLAAQRDFYIGTAVNTRAFARGGAIYRDMLKREFNVLVAENMMKFSELRPAQNDYNWAQADALVDFAEAIDMRLRGHTLVSHQQLPHWVTSGDWTTQEAWV